MRIAAQRGSLTRDSMKTTLGVALTPPSAAALIAGACVLAAAFMPSCQVRGPGAAEPPQLTAVADFDAAAAAKPAECATPQAKRADKPAPTPALARPAPRPESSNNTRSR
ncbi:MULTISPECIES: hypothetical protein [unclassified Lysobacter]|uniref:hypothetical protein n=1 Tax=unclassified Lysobacter TaxID=2635362 RepID=UPI001BEC1CAC|nr:MULTISPECIES: hypothetical protein [unclassified Lysobacter]MBT2748778.1 hypothetical protein [Lysobacter sp. ISL-42]MBT2753128.1 hypothetical protein [Lysobacter sp. ISL-50]MBT2779815.1 hypothetical protein [Lysobacter sp. ISL-54]MBT2782411.1 hypothetical protein [Lysobacter sp. ISL-52]